MPKSFKEVYVGGDAIDKLVKGIKKVSDIVKSTLGPFGRNSILIRTGVRPVITNDGVTIAREVAMKDPVANAGVKVMQEVAMRTNEMAGDGTSTAIVLACNFITNGLKRTRAGVNVMKIKHGMQLATEVAINTVKELSTIINDDLTIINSIATISGNNDIEIGNNISKAFELIGKDGIVLAEESKTNESTVKLVEGLQINRGYMSPYFITDPITLECVYNSPYILLYNGELKNIHEIIELLNIITSRKLPIILIADDVNSSIMNIFVTNRMAGNLHCAIVRSPEFAEARTEVMEDIACLLNTTLYREEEPGPHLYVKDSPLTPEMLGTCTSVRIGKDSTTFLGYNGDKERIKNRILHVKELMKHEISSRRMEKLERRLGMLSGGIATISIGANSEAELIELKYRYEDALNATRAAINFGVVPGGGRALFEAYNAVLTYIDNNKLVISEEELMGATIIADGLFATAKAVVDNAGQSGDVVYSKLAETENNIIYDLISNQYKDYLDAGVIDPTLVITSAITNASSVASMVLTTDSVVYEYEE